MVKKEEGEEGVGLEAEEEGEEEGVAVEGDLVSETCSSLGCQEINCLQATMKRKEEEEEGEGALEGEGEEGVDDLVS